MADERRENARRTLGSVLRVARIAPERAGAVEKAVMEGLAFPGDVLIPQSRLQDISDWGRLLAALEGSFPRLVGVLAEDEVVRLKEALARLAPRK